ASGADGDAATATPFCATLSPAPTFCDDFERTEVKGPWGTVASTPGTVLALERKDDGGTALLASMPDFQSGATAGAHVYKTFSDGGMDFEWSFELRIEALPARGEVNLVAINLNENAQDLCSVILGAR